MLLINCSSSTLQTDSVNVLHAFAHVKLNRGTVEKYKEPVFTHKYFRTRLNFANNTCQFLPKIYSLRTTRLVHLQI